MIDILAIVALATGGVSFVASCVSLVCIYYCVKQENNIIREELTNLRRELHGAFNTPSLEASTPDSNNLEQRNTARINQMRLLVAQLSLVLDALPPQQDSPIHNSPRTTRDSSPISAGSDTSSMSIPNLSNLSSCSSTSLPRPLRPDPPESLADVIDRLGAPDPNIMVANKCLEFISHTMETASITSANQGSDDMYQNLRTIYRRGSV